MKQKIYVFLGPNLEPLVYNLEDVMEITKGMTEEIKVVFHAGTQYDRTHPTNVLLCHRVEFQERVL